MVIRHLHKYEGAHLETVAVKEVFFAVRLFGRVMVEVFTVTLSLAKKPYAWSAKQGTPEEQFTAVLEIPPLVDPVTAVRVSIVADAKKEK